MRILLILIFVAIVVSKQDYYSILGLKKGAPQDQVKKQFRKLSLKYHPDKNKHPQAESKYKEITHAYQQIMDGKTEDEDNIPPPRYSQSTFTFHGDPFAQHHYYQSYQTYTRTSQNSGYYGEAFLYILVLIFLLLIFNFIRGQVGDQQQSQQQQEQQQQQQQQQQQYKTQQQHSSQEQTNPVQSRKDIKEKVSNVSSYTESDHRFKFHENFKE